MWRASERFLTGPPPFPPRRPEPGEPMPDPRDALRVKPWWTLRDLARATARDPRLQMVIERFATYAGADPRRAPAALAVAGYVEHAFGAWHPRGGMYELVLAMVRRLEALGGELRLSTPVERVGVAHGRVWGVETSAGAFTADAVVTDVDERVVRTRLLGRPARRRTPSLSGLALLLGVRDDAPAHHRILFPPDYDAEFDDIFEGRRMPRDPTLYVCAPPEQGWFVLVNAPASPRRLGRDDGRRRRPPGRVAPASSSASPPPTSAARSTAARRTAAWARCAGRATGSAASKACGSPAAPCTPAAASRS